MNRTGKVPKTPRAYVPVKFLGNRRNVHQRVPCLCCVIVVWKRCAHSAAGVGNGSEGHGVGVRLAKCRCYLSELHPPNHLTRLENLAPKLGRKDDSFSRILNQEEGDE